MLTVFNSLPLRVQAHAGRTTRPLSAGRRFAAASRTSFGRPDVASAPLAQAWLEKTAGILRRRGNAFGVFRRQPHIRIDKEPKVRTIIRDFEMVFKSFLKLFSGFEVSAELVSAETSKNVNNIYHLEHFFSLYYIRNRLSIVKKFFLKTQKSYSSALLNPLFSVQGDNAERRTRPLQKNLHRSYSSTLRKLL